MIGLILVIILFLPNPPPIANLIYFDTTFINGETCEV